MCPMGKKESEGRRRHRNDTGLRRCCQALHSGAAALTPSSSGLRREALISAAPPTRVVTHQYPLSGLAAGGGG